MKPKDNFKTLQRVNLHKSSLLRHLPPLLFLLLANLLYCHRLYGVFFPLEGDALFHIYFRLNDSILKSGHNPYQWYFTDLMSFTGINNPILWFSRFLLSVFHFEPLKFAVLVNMLTSFLCSFLLSSTTYGLFSYLKLSQVSAFLGALVVTFTGLHLSGIREFDYVFQYSFIFVPLVLIGYLEIIKRKTDFVVPFFYSSIALGLSFWGGGNIPMFFYLPFCAFLPLIEFKNHKDLFILRNHYLLLGGTIILAFGIGAVAILPTATSLNYSNRVEIQFDHIARSLSPFLKLATLFLRDWFPLGIIHYHERDYFIGLPVLVLFSLGILSLRRSIKTESWLMLLFLSASILITHYTYLPEFLAFPIGRFYDLLSIRNSNRFFLLGLLPCAYFAGVGLDSLSNKAFPFVTAVLVICGAFLVNSALLPSWNFMLPDSILAATYGILFSLLAVIALALCWLLSEKPALKYGPVLFIFLMYYVAPIQLTNYLAHYFNDRSLLGNVSSERLSGKGFFGLSWNYSDIWRRGRHIFLESPDDLQNPEYKTGRILDYSESDPAHGKYPNLFAAQTGHHFAFTLVNDHLSSLPMQELFKAKTPAILDLNSVCWERDLKKNPSITYRKSCLPQAFYVPSFIRFQSKKALLDWMSTTTTQEFKSSIGIDCSKTNCNFIQGTAGAKGTVQYTEKPGAITLNVNSESNGFVFISSHYRKDWLATVNGQEVEVLPSNYAFMAVPVSQGNSSIELKLNLTTHKIGMGISLFSLTFAVLFLLLYEESKGVKFKWKMSSALSFMTLTSSRKVFSKN